MPQTVFITNQAPSHDYAKAATFGAIRPVTSGNYPIFKTARLREEIIAALVHSTPDDYLLISGSSVVAALCVAIWLELHKRCRMLLFDRSRGHYVERVYDRSETRLEVERARDTLQAVERR